jgi:hypothetical protein
MRHDTDPPLWLAIMALPFTLPLGLGIWLYARLTGKMLD